VRADTISRGRIHFREQLLYQRLALDPMSRFSAGYGLVFLTTVILNSSAQESPPAKQASALPKYRIDVSEFEASEADIRAVCDSAARQLWPLFPDYDLEPFVVTRGKSGPIALYERNAQKEIVLRLDTGKTFWSQYAYQFGHEFCHVLCHYRPSDGKNLWFEETLCETASLYVMRGMAREWKDKPPYANWRDYRDSLREYADNIIGGRKHMREIQARGLSSFYEHHEAELRMNPTNRDLNGAMAVVMLSLFEEEPARWEAIRWLNESPAPADETFTAYLSRWHAAVPARHQKFVTEVAELYGVKIAPQ
jgi:hypothetical protein